MADYFGLAITTAGELVHCDLSAYPHVVAWLDRLKARPSYAEVYAAFNGFAASTRAATSSASPLQAQRSKPASSAPSPQPQPPRDSPRRASSDLAPSVGLHL